jgi:hypothetical protein
LSDLFARFLLPLLLLLLLVPPSILFWSWVSPLTTKLRFSSSSSVAIKEKKLERCSKQGPREQFHNFHGCRVLEKQPKRVQRRLHQTEKMSQNKSDYQ